MKPLLRLLRAAFAGGLVCLNTVLHCMPLFAVALAKFLLPSRPLRTRLSAWLVRIAESWIACNSGLFELLARTEWDVEGLQGLSPERSYLVLANHQSWVDIPVLQKVFNRRIPFLRFFLKRELIWVPLLGLAWWALDFPFMRRYSREQLARRPELRGTDLEVTRRACEKFRAMPVAVMNFVEGTRFTAAKHAASQGRYRHLLPPRAGGTAFVLDAMGDALDAVLDVTLRYPCGRPSLLDLLAGDVRRIQVRVHRRPIPAELLGGDYQNDPASRERFQRWINRIWEEKDAELEALAAAERA
ncbi:MAG: acyltransferase [Lysobacteraceae bacterium]|nr:MAG: acyltransferase [Xanthomonadaceae bacterium]